MLVWHAKIVVVLSKQEELILDLIEQIKDPVVKAQKLSKFHETLVRETSKPKPRIQEPKVDLEKIYNRFTKSKKEVTVNDLQHEIKETKSEVRSLKQELTILNQVLIYIYIYIYKRIGYVTAETC